MQPFMFFHMVALVLLSVVTFSTILLLVKILQQPFGILEIQVAIAAVMENKMHVTLPHKRAQKYVLETGVINCLAFCLGPSIKKIKDVSANCSIG